MAILLLNLTSFTIIGFIGQTFNIANINNMAISTRVAVDCAIITLIFNFIAQSVNEPGKISVNLSNSLDVKQILLKKGRKAKIDISIYVDYKHKWIRKVIETSGGLQLEIINTNWTSIEIDKRDEYDEIIDYSNPSKKIVVNLNGINSDNQVNGKLYLTLIVDSNKSIKNDGIISTRIVQKETGFIKNLVFKTFIDTICDFQELGYREEKE